MTQIKKLRKMGAQSHSKERGSLRYHSMNEAKPESQTIGNKNLFNMKKIFFIFIAITLCAIGVFTSCKKIENSTIDSSSKNEDINDIIGKWQLKEVVLLFTPTGQMSYDYSQYNIVYDFKSDATLIVSEDIANIDMYGYLHESGEHYYTTFKDESGGYVLNIDSNFTFWYSVSSGELIIDNSSLDGPKYYFVKLNK